MKYVIAHIDQLIPLEQIFSTHLKNLEEMIDRDGFILKAIIADKNTGTILDGSHRYAYFLKKGFKTVPVHWVDYDDENIRVGTHLGHRFLIEYSTNISKNECKERALVGNLFPPRTTRHFFPFRKADISLPLDQLKQGSAEDVAHLVADVDISEEIAHNERYIDEINEEVKIIINYLSEMSQTEAYLAEQIVLMKRSRKVAFFPGKFHPPHVGHILTILRILPKYSKLVIGVTEDCPENRVTSVSDIVDTLNLFFKSFDNVEICLIRGILVKKTSLNGLPDFDVLLSGNQKVLSWAKKHNAEAEHIPRSEGAFCEGSEIRSIITGGGKNEKSL